MWIHYIWYILSYITAELEVLDWKLYFLPFDLVNLLPELFPPKAKWKWEILSAFDNQVNLTCWNCALDIKIQLSAARCVLCPWMTVWICCSDSFASEHSLWTSSCLADGLSCSFSVWTMTVESGGACCKPRLDCKFLLIKLSLCASLSSLSML